MLIMLFCLRSLCRDSLFCTCVPPVLLQASLIYLSPLAFTSLFGVLVYWGSEICLLRELCQHPCVVTLLDVQYATSEVLYMVFEYMDQVR